MKNVKDIILAKSYYLNEQYKHAVKIFNRISNLEDKLKGDVTEFHYYFGLTYLKLGERDKAKAELTKVYCEDNEYRDIKTLIKELS